MLSDDSTSTRRTLLHTIGIGGATGLAGCAGVLDGGSDESTSGDDGTDTESEPTAAYSQVTDFDSSVDATELDSYSFTAGVERSLDGETTVLDGEVADACVIRDNEDYSGEILEEAGLYNEILDGLEEDGDSEYTVSTDQLIPGNNLLHLEVEVNDEEHGHQETYTFEEAISVETTPEQALEQTWIEDRDLFQTLRAQHREDILSTTAEYSGENSQLEEGATWMDIANMIYDYAEEEGDMDIQNKDFEDRVSLTGFIWADLASDAVDGAPSGQANYLAFTLEELEDVEATLLPNNSHHTVPFYKRDEDKMYHLDSTSGALNFPPREGRWVRDHQEESPMWITDEEQLGGAKSTLATFGEVKNDKLHQEAEIADETAESGMARLKEGTDQETMVNTMQYLGVSTALSPNLDFEISGDIDDPEISVSF